MTASPLGAKDGEWVADFDAKLAAAADRGKAVEPMTTIGWLLNHIASAPGAAAKLDILAGPRKSSTKGAYQQMWSYTIHPQAEDAVAARRRTPSRTPSRG